MRRTASAIERDLDAVLPHVDAVMLLRIQRERFAEMPISDARVRRGLPARPPPLGARAQGCDRHASRSLQSRHGARRLRARVRRLALRATGATTASRSAWPCSIFSSTRARDDGAADPRRPRRRSGERARCVVRRAPARRRRRRDRRAPRADRAEETVVDAAGAVVAPGFVDMHVHLRRAGFSREGDASRPERRRRFAADSPRSPACRTRSPRSTIRRSCAALIRETARAGPLPRLSDRRDHARPRRARALRLRGAGRSRRRRVFRRRRHRRERSVLRDAALRARDVSGAVHLALRARGRASWRATFASPPRRGKAWHIAHVSTARALDADPIGARGVASALPAR